MVSIVSRKRGSPRPPLVDIFSCLVETYSGFPTWPTEKITMYIKKIVNETTIKMRIERMSAMTAYMKCEINESELLVEAWISVEYNMNHQFNCISYNWESMACQPSMHSIFTINNEYTSISYDFSPSLNMELEPVTK